MPSFVQLLISLHDFFIWINGYIDETKYKMNMQCIKIKATASIHSQSLNIDSLEKKKKL